MTGAGSIENHGAITQSVTVGNGLTVTDHNYAISFDANGGTNAPSSMRIYAGSLPAAGATLPSQQPTRDGYSFIDWFITSDGDITWDISTPITSDITLTAHWQINTYTVTFNSNGGNAIDNATVTYGDRASEPDAPTRDGYTFTGWYTADDSTPWDFTTSVTSDITLYAHWDRVDAPVIPVEDSGSTGELPRTGMDPLTWPFAGALLLVLSGAVLLAIRRRNRA